MPQKTEQTHREGVLPLAVFNLETMLRADGFSAAGQMGWKAHLS
jgi:hypothetical protein